MNIVSIFNGVKDFLFMILDFLIGWIHLPNFPIELTESINNFIDLLFENAGILNFFVRINTIKMVIPIIILILNFDLVYKFILWVLKKIPILHIE